MPRLLVVGKKIPRLKCIEWDEWQNHNLLDYQGLLLDCREPSRISNQDGLSKLIAEHMMHGHSTFVVLPEAKDLPEGGLQLSFVPHLLLKPRAQSGKTLRTVGNFEPFASYISALCGHEIIFDAPLRNPHTTPHGWIWQTMISDNVDRAVCGKFVQTYVFHPPAQGRDSVAVKAILDFFKPEYEEPEPDERPQWAGQFSALIAGVSEIETRVADTSLKISSLQLELAALEAKKQELERWTEMLWLDGVPLQARVSDAFKLLGVPNESKDPTGHKEDLEASCGGRPILFEVTGSKGAIGVDKARQLLQWISESKDPASTKGVLVGNAYRADAPDKRPPTPNHKIFGNEVEQMARKFHFALVDVRDLFKLVLRKLNGEELRPDFVCDALQADGVVTFEAQ